MNNFVISGSYSKLSAKWINNINLTPHFLYFHEGTFVKNLLELVHYVNLIEYLGHNQKP